MLIVSFAWTTGAFLAGRKSRTRRHWTPEFAARFKPGMVCQGWNRGPRNGGHKIGLFKVLRSPYPQNTAEMTEADFEAEGFKWMEEQGITMRGTTPRQFFEDWKEAKETPFVVEFEKLEEPYDRPLL